MADFEGYARKEAERARRRQEIKAKQAREKDEEEFAKIEDPQWRKYADDTRTAAKTGTIRKTYRMSNNQPIRNESITIKRDAEKTKKIIENAFKESPKLTISPEKKEPSRTVNTNQPKSTQKVTTRGVNADTYYGDRQAAKLSSDSRRGQAKVAARNATREDRQRPSASQPTSATGRKTISSQKAAPSRNTISSRKTTGTISSSAKNSGTISDNQSKMTKEAEENKRKAIADAMKNVRRGP